MSLPPSSPWSAYSEARLLLDVGPRSTPSPTSSFLSDDLDAFLSKPRPGSKRFKTPLQKRQDELKAQLRDATSLMSHFYTETTGQTFLVEVMWYVDPIIWFERLN